MWFDYWLFKGGTIGETDHFIWFITDIGIISLYKGKENFETYNSKVETEANKIALDITKEEKEYLKINENQLFLFYSWFKISFDLVRGLKVKGLLFNIVFSN